MENNSKSTTAAAAAKNLSFRSKNLLLGDQYFTEQVSPNSSLFDFSDIT